MWLIHLLFNHSKRVSAYKKHETWGLHFDIADFSLCMAEIIYTIILTLILMPCMNCKQHCQNVYQDMRNLF